MYNDNAITYILQIRYIDYKLLSYKTSIINKFFFIYIFSGEVRVDVRRYIKPKGAGKRYPSKAGFSFNREQWRAFKTMVFRSDACALDKNCLDIKEEFGDNLFLTYSREFESVGIRKWFNVGEQMFAGRPGINLSLKQWRDFITAFSQIDKELMKIEQCD